MTNHPGVPRVQRCVAGALVALALVVVVPAAVVDAQKASSSAVPKTADTATIAHVLNRLGYGPAPGEIDEVRAMTLATYIEQQLHPERIPDEALKAKLAAYPSIALSTSEIARDYFGPAEEMRRQEQRAAAAAGTPPGTAGTPA